MAPSPITSITVKTGRAQRLNIELLDQTGDYIADLFNWSISDPTIVQVVYQTTDDVKIKGLKAGSCTVTFSYKGINKVLNVIVVEPIPTSINIIPHEA